jgi:hypothetical protein
VTSQLKIVFKHDRLDELFTSEVIDLLAYPGHVMWMMGVCDSSTPVDDVLTFHIEGDDDDDLATQVQALDAVITRIKNFDATVDNLFPFLLAQLEGETNYRIAPIFGAQRPDKLDVSGLFIADHILPNYQLTITRGAWENALPAGFYGGVGGTDPLGGVIAYTVDGDLPARLSTLTVSASAATIPMNDLWIGVKTAKRLRYSSGSHGAYVMNDQNLTYFRPWWSLNSAIYKGDDTTGGITDSGSKSTAVVQCTFATNAALEPRVIIRIEDVESVHPKDQAGRYTILLRARTTNAAFEGTVRLGSGFYRYGVDPDDQEFVRLYNVPVSGTSYKLYNLGEVNLPMEDTLRAIDTGDLALLIEAERLNGTSGNLIVDGLVIMPSLEGLLTIHSEAGLNSASEILAYTTPQGETRTYLTAGGSIAENCRGDSQDFGLVPSAGILVFAAHGDGLTSGVTLNVDGEAHERWITLRGDAGATAA